MTFFKITWTLHASVCFMDSVVPTYLFSVIVYGVFAVGLAYAAKDLSGPVTQVSIFGKKAMTFVLKVTRKYKR